MSLLVAWDMAGQLHGHIAPFPGCEDAPACGIGLLLPGSCALCLLLKVGTPQCYIWSLHLAGLSLGSHICMLG